MVQKYEIAVIGAGPGGYVAAIRAAQLKKKVVLIEKKRVGGTCMNWGCIPTKFLLHETKLFKDVLNNPRLSGPVAEITCNWPAVQQEKEKRVDRLVQGTEFLLKKNGITLVKGKAVFQQERRVRIIHPDGGSDEIEAEHIILATGSLPAGLPFIQPDGERILYSREALEMPEKPQHLLVIGAGAIGLELGTIYSRLGTKVTILEILPQILPGSDTSLAKRLERILKSQGLDIRTRMQIESTGVSDQAVTLKGTALSDGRPFEISADKVLIAAGRRTEKEGCLHADLQWDEKNCLKIDDCLQTNIPGVYAIGDLVGGGLLAHKASHQGILAAENILGAGHRWNTDALPMAVFTEPEFASVGLTEADARERLGSGLKTGTFSLQANGRALTLGAQEGMVKIVADANDRIVGAHILAPSASELIPELGLAISKRMTLSDIADSIHIHPTLSESVMEAALHGKRRAIHALNL